ncbi:MAG: hypothetical protein RML15_06200 [Bacteroidota bacterium]|nr:hypothetical protein [Candidatus Kapabacteria bacterium]MCS7303004.1 hypothetical protein [Candidatus Kapabacteria bacterium]MDW8075128.1 hypothetical protein [Bacteroidota bacterium]MDW8271983.1 hypothetical protein [Bacteroidota bacterium]
MKQQRAIWLFVISALGLIVLTLWQVSNVVRINALLVSIEQKQKTLDSLQSLVRQEHIAIARLESAERIRRLARQHLGLIEPSTPPIVVRRPQH